MWKQVAPRKKTHNTGTSGITSSTQHSDSHKLKKLPLKRRRHVCHKSTKHGTNKCKAFRMVCV